MDDLRDHRRRNPTAVRSFGHGVWAARRHPVPVRVPDARRARRVGRPARGKTCIGGLEKEDVTGNVSYDPANHEHMIRTRAQKIANIANDIPLLEVNGPAEGDMLVLGWGGTYGAITTAVDHAQR